jgi:uncharacterized protein (DUF305 family)
LKTLLRKAWPLALLLAATLMLSACGGAGGGQQGSGSHEGGHDMAKNGGMDHDQMGHGSMGMGSGGMAKQMVTKNGEYSDEAFIEAMIPHHRSAIDMATVANQESENPRIKELAGNIVSAQKGEIEQMKRWREQWYQEG